MDAALHRLSISCTQPGAVFRVTDGRSAPVGKGMYRLELDLPPGLYTVSALLGASIESKTVLLDRPKAVEIEVVHRSFGDLAFPLMARIRAALPTSCFGPGATTVVAVRGPYAKAPAKQHLIAIDVDGTPVEPAASDTLTDPSGLWRWQVFRVDDAPSPASGIISAIRAVNGVKTSHVIPRFGSWMVWAAYPAPKEVAQPDVELPPPHYVRLRLTQPATAPDAHLQSLSDQVFTSLGARSALPLSPPVLDLLFAEDADPLLAIAAAHLASLSLGWHGLLAKLPQDEAGSAPAGSTERAPPAHESEPVRPEALLQRVMEWLQRQSGRELADCPDMVAIRSLYGLCDEIDLKRPPVLLRSLDALIRADHAAADSGRNCQLDDSVWRTRFQVSDSFAFLQWETDTRKGEQKRLQVLQQSFKMAMALEDSLRELRKSAQSKGAAAPASGAPAGDAAAAEDQPAPQAMASPQGFGATLIQRAKESAALGRYEAMDVLAKATGSSALRSRASSELASYLKLNAQALRLPVSAVEQLAGQVLKSRSFKK